MSLFQLRGGARGGLEGAIALSEHASPPSEVENYFVGDFWHLQYPESRILATSLEESAPLSENSWRHPCFNFVQSAARVSFLRNA